MLALPKNWGECMPHLSVGYLLDDAERCDTYYDAACGLMYAYLAHFVEDELALKERRIEILKKKKGIFIVNDYEWRVLPAARDDELYEITRTRPRRSVTNIVVPPWAEGMALTWVQARVENKSIDVTSVTSLLSLRVIFSAIHRKMSRKDSLARVFQHHNAYCAAKGFEAVRIAV